MRALGGESMRSWQEFKKSLLQEDISFSYARTGDLEAMRSLNLSPEQRDEKDSKGYSLLMLAAYHGHQELVSYLLQIGANPNSIDGSGNTILMGAAFKGHLAIVRELVENGADVRMRNPKGQVALDFALMFGRQEVALFLREQQQRPAKPSMFAWLRRRLGLISSGYGTKSSVREIA